MFKYSDKGLFRNSVFTHLIISLMLWLPVAALFFYVAIAIGELHFYFLSFSVLLILALLLLKMAQTSITFPTIEVTDTHLVTNLSMSRRAVYNLEYIEGAKLYFHMLYFRHNGWPVIIPLPKMPKELRLDLLVAIIRPMQNS